MKGMMLGWIADILKGITDAISNVFSWLLEKLINWIVVPVLEVLFIIIQYVVSGLFYGVSVFLLSLIDFLEALFRALAGLPYSGSGPKAQFTFEGSLVEGDLLIELLTSKEILQAFQATAIVGIFLLIIMTIFQMIKVEYTTEGAENNKTKIMGKSLKSLTNLLLIPALVVFGVFIGNQILDLIDTATKGEADAKISGTLFVAAASNAMYKENDLKIKISNTGEMIGISVRAAFCAVGNSDADGAKLLKGFADDFPKLSKSDIAKIDFDSAVSNFKSHTNGFTYGNVEKITQYYNLFEVNYLVLIFGSCIILKCLFNICFGLIDRIYRCLALFIVAPFVIGMTPVKDSLASWRTNFIGKALSAYGTVISMNLFFTIVSIFLGIGVKITGLDTIAPLLNSNFCEGLVKSIFVIVGCMMIEKLAADMGNYFGASDGLAAGKALAGEATAGIAKAASVGMGIATGGASLAMRAGKGIAGAVGKTANFVTGGKAGEVAGKIKGGISKGVDTAKSAVGKGLGAATSWAGRGLGIGHSKKQDKQMASINDQQKKLDRLKYLNSLSGAARKSTTKERDTLMSELGVLNKGGSKADIDREIAGIGGALDGEKNRLTNSMKRKDFRKGMIKSSADKAKESLSHVGRNATLGWNALKHYGSEGVKGALPKQLTGMSAAWDKHMQAGAADSPELSAAYEKYKEEKKDAAKARAENDPINAKFIAHQHMQMNEMLQIETAESMRDEQRQTNKQLEKMNAAIEKLVTARNKPGVDDATKARYNDAIFAKQQEMMSINPNITFNSADSALDKAALDTANKAAMNEVNAHIADLEKIFIANKDKSQKEILAAFESYFKGAGSHLDGDKLMQQIMKALEDIQSRIGK